MSEVPEQAAREAERVRVEAALRESEARFRTLAEFAPVGIYETDAAGRCRFVNRRWCELTGLSPEEASGDGWMRALHPDDAERVARAWFEGAQHGEPFEFEYRFRRPDGHITWVQGAARPLRDRGGVIVGYLGTVTNVTERRLAEDRAYRLYEAERVAANRLQILADATRVFSQERDPAALLRAVAEQVGEALGQLCVVMLRSSDAKLETSGVYHQDPEARAKLQQMLDAAPLLAGEGLNGLVFSTGRSLLLPEIPQGDLGPQLKPEHRAFFARYPLRSVVVAPLHVSGEVIGTLALGRHEGAPYTVADQVLVEELAERAGLAISSVNDMAAKEQALRAMQAAQRELEAAGEQLKVALEAAQAGSRAKDEFLAMLGHELRNPLSPIVTALQIMKMRAGDAMIRERAIIERQVHHLVRLVDDLLDVSRIAQGKVELKLRPVEIADVVAKAIETTSPLLEQRRHTLTTSVPQEGLRVMGDEHRLAQIASNLLTNAAKYTEPGGRVEVTAARRGGKVLLVVRDSGTGIPPDLLPKVFHMFVQGERTIDRSQGGLGLGLSIVRSLVELHGGAVAAASEGPGLGTEITVELPLLQAEASAGPSTRREGAAEAGADACAHARVGRGRVLVVDDNRDAAESLADALTSSGYVAEIAFDGPSALALATARCPEVALIDIGLPVMDGYELARRLREARGDGALRLVAVTGYGQEADRQRSAEAGFHAHLVKPIDLDRLLRLLDQPP